LRFVTVELPSSRRDAVKPITPEHHRLAVTVSKSQRPPTVRTPACRYIPADVRREVWTRDGGRCQERLQSGGICGATHRVEFHYLHEHARGGPATSSNLTLRCAFHNFRAAESSYGEEFMRRFRSEGEDR